MIYEIVCNETGERYIGSTFQTTLARRMSTHRDKSYNHCISKQIIGRGNYYYNLLEKVNVETKDELRMYERKWYDNLPNINKLKPFITKEEHFERVRLWEKTNENRIERNKQKNLSRNKEPIQCECGGQYTTSNKSYHIKTKKHLGI